MINNLKLWQGVSYSCSVERLTGSRWRILSRIRRSPTAEGPSLSRLATAVTLVWNPARGDRNPLGRSKGRAGHGPATSPKRAPKRGHAAHLLTVMEGPP